MFERELTDSLFLQRWSIVRTLMPQSVAEHTFLVAHYANDICVMLGVSTDIHLSTLQLALWHDAKDEIFTGDLPGPNKRGLLDAIGPDAKKRWNAKLQEWAERVFPKLYQRSGGHVAHSNSTAQVVELILKTADWLEASVRMATETQMGNRCCERHIIPNRNGASETARKLVTALIGDPDVNTEAAKVFNLLDVAIVEAVANAMNGQSEGPWITKEDDSRTYHDHCVDNVA